MKVLAIETSCDETSIALVEGDKNAPFKGVKILSNVVFSQIPLHREYGGVIPEVASRAHLLKIGPTFKEALSCLKTEQAKTPKDLLRKVDFLAVTSGPGLIGSLLVGVNFAKALAWATQKPLFSVNHLEGHIYANFINENSSSFQPPVFPLLCLIVSGGHTLLVLMKDHLKYKIVGQTLDDAAGEAFDKVGKLLDLPYPAGPFIEEKAKKGNPSAFSFPRPLKDRDDFNFSFSGLKTAVLYTLKYQKINLKDPQTVADICASFQQAVVDVLVKKTLKAAAKYKAASLVLSGGVAANQFLKETMEKASKEKGIPFFSPSRALCTDNAAMIGAAAVFYYLKNKRTPFEKIEAHPSLSL